MAGCRQDFLHICILDGIRCDWPVAHANAGNSTDRRPVWMSAFSPRNMAGLGLVDLLSRLRTSIP